MRRSASFNLSLHESTPLEGRDWLLPLLALALVALQMTWCAGVQLGGGHLDLLLLGVVSVGLLRSWRTGAAYGLGSGLLCGWVFGANVGTYGLTRMLVGGLCALFGLRFEPDHVLAPSLCAALGVLLSQLLSYVMAPGDFRGRTGAEFGSQLVGALVLNALVAPLIYFVFARVLVRPERMMFGSPSRF